MLGPVFYLLFYLGTGIIASLVHIFISGPDSSIPSVGASGASEGVMGGYLVLFPGQQVHVLLPDYGFRTGRMSAVALLGFWFVLQFLTGDCRTDGEHGADGRGCGLGAHRRLRRRGAHRVPAARTNRPTATSLREVTHAPLG